MINRLKCINVASILITLICLASVTMTFVFSRRISELEARNVDFTLRLTANEDFQASEQNRVQEIIDMVSHSTVSVAVRASVAKENQLVFASRVMTITLVRLLYTRRTELYNKGQHLSTIIRCDKTLTRI